MPREAKELNTEAPRLWPEVELRELTKCPDGYDLERWLIECGQIRRAVGDFVFALNAIKPNL